MNNVLFDSEEYAKTIGKNLKRIAYMRDKTQADISRDLGINKATVSSWMNGTRMPRMSKIDLLCEYFHVTREEIMEEYVGETKAYDAVKVPILGKVAAGQPIEMIEDVVGDVTIEQHKGSQFFALEIKGDSMSPRIQNGDVVIVRKQPTVESGEIAIVAINGDEATCKKIRYMHDGMEIIPLNPSYEAQFYPYDQVQSLPITIIGKVVEMRAKF